MILLAHMLTGAVAGVKIGNPALVAVVSLASHFLLDLVPHKDFDAPKKAEPKEFLNMWPDLLSSIAVFFALLYSYPEHWVNLLIGVTFAILPDVISIFGIFPAVRRGLGRFLAFHAAIQVRVGWTLGLTTQIMYIAILLFVLKAL